MIEQGESEVRLLQDRLKAALALTRTRLQALGEISFIEPDGAFYCFFSVAGLTDSLGFAHAVLHHTKVGLAPGLAFGPAGEGYLRLCYAQDETILNEAFDRLENGFQAAKACGHDRVNKQPEINEEQEYADRDNQHHKLADRYI